MDYLHFNPVKHGWVKNVVDWPYSSFHRYLQNGVYSTDWAGGDFEDIEMVKCNTVCCVGWISVALSDNYDLNELIFQKM